MTDGMCLPQYWTGDGDYDLVLSKREIKELNARILNSENTMMNDLSTLRENGTTWLSNRGYRVNIKRRRIQS